MLVYLFGSPRSILSLGVFFSLLFLFVHSALLGGIWWYAALPYVALAVMWLVWLAANRNAYPRLA